MKKKVQFTNILIGILFTIFIISSSVIFVINFRPLYYMDIDALNIPAQSGLSKEEIIENYDTLIDYCSPFFKGDLIFPTLDSSKEGIIHFEEVKEIFVSFYYFACISFPILIWIIVYKHRKKEYSYLKTASLTCIILPTIVGIASMINFENTFLLFHKLAFQNDYWIFDPTTDPVILMLPEDFFLHCALVIVAFVILASFLLYIIYSFLKKKRT